eukprot:2077464-Prymnesium_polylepis.1
MNGGSEMTSVRRVQDHRKKGSWLLAAPHVPWGGPHAPPKARYAPQTGRPCARREAAPVHAGERPQQGHQLTEQLRAQRI